MRIEAKCPGCGGAFAAPASLGGQTVKCPKCAAAVSLPKPAKPPAPTRSALQEAEIDFDSLSSESAVGRPAVKPSRKQSPRKQKKSTAASDTSDEGDLQGRMERLYGLYTNQELVVKRRGRFTLGLGICLAIVLIGGSIGTYVVMHRGTSSVATVTQAPTIEPDAVQSGEAAAIRAEIETAESAVAEQTVDPEEQWSVPTAASRSTIQPSRLSVEPAWSDQGRLHTFTVRLEPASGTDPNLLEHTEVILYRAESEAGPFRQVDRTKAQSKSDDSDAVAIHLMDATFLNAGLNRVFYRLRGVDSLGKLVFDTTAVAHPVILCPKISGARVTWKSVAPGSDAPHLHCLVYLDGDEEWENVLIGHVAGQGQIDATLPKAPFNVPQRVVLSATMPQRFKAAAGSTGTWEIGPVEYEIASREAKAQAASLGVVPISIGDTISYKLIGGDQAFLDVSLDANTLSFRTATSSVNTLELPDPPAPTHLVVTPFDTEIRLAWNNETLLAGRQRYEQEVAVAIFRTDEHTPRRLIGTVPATVSSFVDTGAPQTACEYEVAVTATDGAYPRLGATAWLSDIGEVPVLIKIAHGPRSGQVFTEPSLRGLQVAIGKDELACIGTDRTAINLLESITRTLLKDDITIIDRARRRPDDPTIPAQVLLRLVDSTTPAGNRVGLWATDLPHKTNTLLGETGPGAAADAATILQSLRTYLDPRRRTNNAVESGGARTPQSIVLDRLIPADQTWRFHGSNQVTRQLADTLTRIADVDVSLDPEHSGDAVLRIAGRCWRNAKGPPGLVLWATSALTGRVIDTWRADAFSPKKATAFAKWAAALQLPRETVPAATPSRLLTNEDVVEPIHLVWQTFGRLPEPSAARRRIQEPRDAIVISFGLALPAHLQAIQPTTQRPADDELAAIRPLLAPTFPPMFEQWVKAYARYIEADYSAFKTGIADFNKRVHGAGEPVLPRIIVRGKEKVVGNSPLTMPGALRDAPGTLNTRKYLKVGASQQALVDYHAGLGGFFQNNPWTAYQAWQEVGPSLAEPFLKVELYGVEDERLNKISLPKSGPPRPHKFVAAKILAQLGDPTAQNYEKKSLELAARLFNTLAQNQGRPSKRNAQRRVTNAMYILLIEDDPGVIGQLIEPSFRDKYLVPESATTADLLRLLVDRVGPEAWQWKPVARVGHTGQVRQVGTPDDMRDTGGKNKIAWESFRWRSPEEMRAFTADFPTVIPEPLRQQVRAWLDGTMATP